MLTIIKNQNSNGEPSPRTERSMNNLPCLNCEKSKTQMQIYYSLPFTTKAQQYLLNLIAKHQNFATQQRLYTLQETHEQEFLNKIAQELINGLLGESQYSQLIKAK